LQINKIEPSEIFGHEYLQQAKDFAEFAKKFREQAVLAEKVA